MNPVWGRLLIVACAVLWSTNGFFAKAPIWDEWPLETRGMTLAFWRALFAGVLILPFVRRPRFGWRLLPMALAFTAMNALFLNALTLTTAANAIWLQCTAPLWVFVYNLATGREPLDRHDLAPLALGMLGVGLILSMELRQTFAGDALTPAALYNLAGVGCGLASGVAYAMVVVGMRALRDYDSAWLVVVNHLVTSLLLAPYCLLWIGQSVSPAQFGVLAAFGLFQMGLPYLLFAQGLRHVSSQEGAGLALLEPLLVPVWVYLSWGEQTAWWTFAGGALILVGLVLRYTWTPPKSSPAPEL